MTLVLSRSGLEAIAEQAAATRAVRAALAERRLRGVTPRALNVLDDARLVPILGLEGATGLASLRLLVDRPRPRSTADQRRRPPWRVPARVPAPPPRCSTVRFRPGCGPRR